MQYRPEIDGLRALAVIPVILFHAGFSAFSGGFVGVDVFFVISGYLITTILMNDIEAGHFSLAHFYERRARRILPALFCVIAVCLPFAWAWLLPSQMQDFSHSLVAVGLFASNILFWKESGYFEATAEEKPLLHTWSLAVEEQYYLLFPIFLVMAWRFGRRPTFWLIAFFAAISLALAEWGWRHEANANFYLAPTRAWELFAGSLAAFVLQKRGAPRGHEGMAVLGLVAILAAVALYDRATPFPSLYALLPVGGTVLLILCAHRGTFVAKVLSFKPLVGVGLISYSAYLWHQPLFAFARVRMMEAPSAEIFGVLIALSFVLAGLSWRFVEQPFRKSDGMLATRKMVFIFAGCGLAAMIGFGALGSLSQGFAQRVSDDIARMDAQAHSVKSFSSSCRLGMVRQAFRGGRENNFDHPLAGCWTRADQETHSVMLIGDSHMEVIAPVLRTRLKDAGISSYAVSYIGCVPLAGFYRTDYDQQHLCDDYNRSMIDYAHAAGIRTVILFGRFPLYLEGSRFDNGEGGVEAGDPAYIDVFARQGKAPAPWSSEERMERVSSGYVSGLNALLDAGLNVVLVEAIPEAGWSVPHYLAKAMMHGYDAKDGTSLQAYHNRNRRVFDAFDQVAHPSLYRVPSADAFCAEDTGRCQFVDEGGVMYRDDDHLSDYGAEKLIPALLEQVNAALATQ